MVRNLAKFGRKSLFDLPALPRRVKFAIVIALDIALVPLSFFLALGSRMGTARPWDLAALDMRMVYAIWAFSIALLFIVRLYRMRVRTLDISIVTRLATYAFLIGIVTVVAGYFTNAWLPRSMPILYGAIFFFLAFVSRAAAHKYINWYGAGTSTLLPVAIYGAGVAGNQLANALQQNAELNPVIFIDDNPATHGLYVAGLKVAGPSRLKAMAQAGQVKRVLLAIPSLKAQQRAQKLEFLEGLGLEVQIVPSYAELVSGRSTVTELRPVSTDDLLGRDTVALDDPAVTEAYTDHVVMVTGAGGSIGSELCRQILSCKPKALIMFERSEHALYLIDQQMAQLSAEFNVPVVPVLGSILDPQAVNRAIEKYEVGVIFHAAAYKHVPLVEDNPLEGARNNIIGTRIVAEAAAKARIDRFILVSTDKAVRPANIMGATKRLAELVVQDIQTRHPATRFTMVRFGNVLGSSGSVVPLFQHQLRNGGPITVTHPEVTRFFMTIPEAARLVLLAGAYAEGADVFVLDMGQPVKIVDLARRMIQLSGLSEKNRDNPDGDIEVKFVGLRPGEKLYEELLIDQAGLVATPHPKILRAREKSLSEIEVAAMLQKIQQGIVDGDRKTIRKTIIEFLRGDHVMSAMSEGKAEVEILAPQAGKSLPKQER